MTFATDASPREYLTLAIFSVLVGFWALVLLATGAI